jgi:VWFA-related protein
MRFIRFSGSIRLLLIFFSLFVFSAFAQDEKQDDVIRVDTDLIQTNVTVVDKSGKPVAGLKPEQFVLKIEGKPTRIDFFDTVVTSVTDFNESNNSAGSGDKPGDAPAPVSLRDRKVVFFVDDFHLSLDGLSRTRAAINHFIDNDMMSQDQVIIIAASGNLGFLQQFTSNKTVLRMALAKLRVYPNTYRDTDQPPMPEYVAVRILNGDRRAGEFYVEKMMQSFNSRQTNMLTEEAALDMIKRRANNIVSGMAASTKNTLASLENILLTGSELKGKKLIFLLSDGFYLEDGHTLYATTDGLQRAVNLATRSGASIYTIDARGLFSLVGADATGERPFDPQGRLDKGAIGEEMASQDGMATLANLTGGRFLKNQNYFDKWIDRMIDENSTYYVLAWTPEKENQLSKKFNDIEISVEGRPDVTVQFQRGYLSNWEQPGGGQGKKKLPTKLALSYLDVPNVGGVASTSVQIASNGLFYGLKNDQPAAVQIFGKILDAHEKQVGDFKTGLTLKPPATGADSSTEQDVIYNSKNPLPPGLYQVQVFVREPSTGNLNSVAQWIEIPDLSKRQLTLSSLFIGGKPIAGSAAGAPAQVQFSVDHRFRRPINLDFTSFIYNAAKSTDAADVNLSTRVEVLNTDGMALIDTTLRPLQTKGNPDLARIPVRGSIKQPEISPGNYLLRVTVADNIAQSKAVQEVLFTVN